MWGLAAFWFAPVCYAQEPTPPSSPVSLAAHRGIYDVTLRSAKNGSSVQGVKGTMLFDLSDTCDGWATQQQMQLHFNFADGEDSDVSSTVVTWEAKDSSTFRFNVKRVTDGQQDAAYKGVATMATAGGQASYTLPKDKAAIGLKAGTLFPTRHTSMILQKAMEGEKLFMRRVYDGSDEEGMVDASAFIGAKMDPSSLPAPEGAKASHLLEQPLWPVRIAFYTPDSQTGEPEYEMELMLQQNGIARSMMIDYGEFSIIGELKTLEAGDVASCAPAKE